jgi:uncharacterized protein (DUF302 family)
MLILGDEEEKTMINYGFTKELDSSFDETVTRVTEALKKEGFSILTSIDVRQKFKEKLGIDFPRYLILGACNPTFAYQAITAEENIGLMLPCNILVYEKGGKTVLSVMKPTFALQVVSNLELADIALIVEAKLKSVFDSV